MPSLHDSLPYSHQVRCPSYSEAWREECYLQHGSVIDWDKGKLSPNCHKRYDAIGVGVDVLLLRNGSWTSEKWEMISRNKKQKVELEITISNAMGQINFNFRQKKPPPLIGNRQRRRRM